MDPHVKKGILKLIAKGWLIKLPGGTSRDGSHASFSSMIKKKYIGKRYVWTIIVIPYKPKDEREKWEDTKEKVFPETFDQTLERETLEETGVSLAKGIYTPIGKQRFPDQRPDHENEWHTQVNFLVTEFDDSNMRKNFSPSERNIGIPIRIELDDDLEKLIASTHLWMIKDVRNHLCCQPNQNLNVKKILQSKSSIKKLRAQVA